MLLGFMEKYSFQQDLIKSLEVAKQKNYSYTYVYSPLIESEFKLLLDENSIRWVLDYKKLRINDFLKQKKLLNIDVDENIFCYIYYFYSFILHDFWHLKKLISHKINNVLNIGAGICLFEIYLNFFNHEIKKFFIIEKNDLIHNNSPIDVLSMAKSTVYSYQLEKKFNFYNDIDFKKINKKFDLILSFRSWAYKYDINVYLDFVLKSINKKSVLIIDIRNKYDEEIILKNFEKTNIITEYPDHKRYYLTNFIN